MLDVTPIIKPVLIAVFGPAGLIAALKIGKWFGEVKTLATNHLCHIDANMTALDQKTEEANKILTSLDKNIALLVDRTK
jgi:hypothetical protein